ncbi:MAG: hypothetical protein EPO65_09125 [Dehalococcoidia bacterium]|nr:MAG: hypothetical protein EPO65_09125 [Dehalococcoidia bacterium]
MRRRLLQRRWVVVGAAPVLALAIVAGLLWQREPSAAQTAGALGIVIPDAAKGVLTQAELVEAVCATSRWRAGELFAAVDAVAAKQPAAQRALVDAGITYALPDPEAMRRRGNETLAAICAAPTVDQAVALVGKLTDINVEMEAAYRAVGTALGPEGDKRSKEISDQVRASINVVVDQKRTQAEADIKVEAQTIADGIVATKKAEYEAQLSAEASTIVAGLGKNASAGAVQAALAPRIAAVQRQAEVEIKAAVDAALKDRIASTEARLKAEIEALAQQTANGERAKWEAKGRAIQVAFEAMGAETVARVEAARKADTPERRAAAEVRVRLAMKVVDAYLVEARKSVNAARAEFTALKAANPSALDADQVLAQMQAARNELEQKLRAAMLAGDETGFNAATLGFQRYWENFAKDLDAAAGVWTPARVCTEAKAGLADARTQAVAAQGELKTAMQSARDVKDANAQQQAILDDFKGALQTASTQVDAFLGTVNAAEQACVNPSGDSRSLIARLDAVRSAQTPLKSTYDRIRALADALQK